MTEYEIHKLIEQQDPETKQRIWEKIQSKLQEEQKTMQTMKKVRELTHGDILSGNNGKIQVISVESNGRVTYCKLATMEVKRVTLDLDDYAFLLN